MRCGGLTRTLTIVAFATGGTLALSSAAMSSATPATPVTAVPSPRPLADQIGTIVRNGVPVGVNITASGQNARFTFSASAGQKVSLYLSKSTFGTPCDAVLLSLLRPDSSPFGNKIGTCGTTGFLDSQTLDATGDWTVLVDPQGTRTGTADLQAFNTNDATALIHLDGSTFDVATSSPGQNGRYKFSGAAGQKVSAYVTNANFPGTCPVFVLSLSRPDGTAFGNTVDGCNGKAFLDAQTLDQSGVWGVLIDPKGMTTGTATLQAYDAGDAQRAITLNGAPVNVDLVPGQVGHYTYSGTVGQRVSAEISSSTIAGAGCPAFAMYLARPNGSMLGNSVDGCNAKAFLDAQTLDQNGTWSIVVDPVGASSGTATLDGYTFADDTGEILLSGKPAFLNFNRPGQNARWTFSGSSGQHISAYVTESNVSPCTVALSLVRPNGTTLGNPVSSCNASVFLETQTLDQSGTWTALVDPQGTGTGTATLRVFDVKDESLSFKPRHPLKTFTALVPGRNARYHFTGVAGDSRTVTITGITYGNTYGQCPTVDVSFVRPNGSELKQMPTCTKVLTLTGVLDAAGTWTLFIDPQGPAMGTMIIRLT
jgi:hypothetical protein